MQLTTSAASTITNVLSSGVSCNIEILKGLSWLESVFSLHCSVRSALPESVRHFLLPRTKEYFSSLLASKDGLLFGAFVGNKLVGSVSLLWTNSFTKALEKEIITCPDKNDRLVKKYGKGSVGIVQSLGISNSHMGRAFSVSLLQSAIEAASRHKCSHIFAQIAAENVLSWLRFLESGFAIISTWKNDHRRFLLRWLNPEEKSALMRKKAFLKRCSFNKSYSEIPIMLEEITASLSRGCIVFLDPEKNSREFFPFVIINH